ncbi:MAG: FAD-dependent oxidoreductase [Balneolaceae bacterium]|nr:MAG: FAD-dependent oxidoreductase [Balneolaceae bacterium]
MRETLTVDLIILGAGFAGLAAADAVRSKGYTCLIVDIDQPGSGASGAPGVLVNPAAGRRARMTWKSQECLNFLLPFIKAVEDFTGEKVCEHNGVFRPALTEKIAEDFKRSPSKYAWPDGWIEWLEPDQSRNRFPFLGPNFGGLFIRPALSLRGYEFCTLAARYLQQLGAEVRRVKEYELKYSETGWTLFNADCEFSAPFLLDCTGLHQVHSPFWEKLHLHAVKGQAATFQFPFALPFSESLSSLGYMAKLPGCDHKLTVGSTYEHHFQNLKPDSYGLQYLENRLENTLPGYSTRYSSVEQWASCRITTPDKMPVAGPHGDLPGLYIIGGLGSKGLLMSRYLGELVVNHIFNDEVLEPEICTSRFQTADGSDQEPFPRRD